MWNIVLLALAGLFIAGCAFTPSQLNANSARYNGITVVVRGFVKLTPGVHVLYESRALDVEIQREWESGNRYFDVRKHERYCVTIANPELLYKNRTTVNAKTVIFQGKFIDNYQSGKSVALGACPLPIAIISTTPLWRGDIRRFSHKISAKLERSNSLMRPAKSLPTSPESPPMSSGKSPTLAVDPSLAQLPPRAAGPGVGPVDPSSIDANAKNQMFARLMTSYAMQQSINIGYDSQGDCVDGYIHVWRIGRSIASNIHERYRRIIRESALERIRANVARYGYHLCTVTGGDQLPRYLYTIGLRERIGPELILASNLHADLRNVGPINIGSGGHCAWNGGIGKAIIVTRAASMDASCTAAMW